MVNYGVASTILLALTAAAAAPAVTANPPTPTYLPTYWPTYAPTEHHHHDRDGNHHLRDSSGYTSSELPPNNHGAAPLRPPAPTAVYKSEEGMLDINNNKEVMSSEEVAVVQEEDIPGFEFVGYGICVDEAGEEYDAIRYLDEYDPEECADLCTECPGKGQAYGMKFLGFNIECDGCYCYVENGGTFSGEVCGTGSSGFDNREGTGEIVGVRSAPGFPCWKVNSKSSKAPKRVRKLGHSRTNMDMRRRLMC
ncbi:hypothetical protein ACHAXM_009770 [Skeletonema potamos]|jgi:hypothetical protein